MKSVQDGNRPSDKYRVPVFNQASEQVPAFGAMQVIASSNVGDDKGFDIIKPNGTPGAKVYLNGPVPIPVSSYGFGTDEYPADALISGTPAFNAEIGPVNGSWGLSASGKGFQFLGGLAASLGRVAAKGGTSAGDDFPLVKIVNASGLPRAFGNIVGFGAPVDPPPGTLHRIPTFLSAAPQAGQPFAVLLSDVGVGATVDAAPIGIVAAALLNFTDATHTRADAVNNNYGNAASGTDGPGVILWRANQGIAGGGTLGLQWSRLLFGKPVAKATRVARVYSTITAATFNTFGHGQVKLQDANTLAVAADPIAADNDNIGTSFETDSQVRLDMNYDPPRVITGSCKAVAWS